MGVTADKTDAPNRLSFSRVLRPSKTYRGATQTTPISMKCRSVYCLQQERERGQWCCAQTINATSYKSSRKSAALHVENVSYGITTREPVRTAIFAAGE